jgi:hypothetical protein
MQAGSYGKYSQDGFALDLVPNLGPTELAKMVQSCRPQLEAGLLACMQGQNISAPTIMEPRTTVNGKDPNLLASLLP